MIESEEARAIRLSKMKRASFLLECEKADQLVSHPLYLKAPPHDAYDLWFPFAMKKLGMNPEKAAMLQPPLEAERFRLVFEDWYNPLQLQCAQFVRRIMFFGNVHPEYEDAPDANDVLFRVLPKAEEVLDFYDDAMKDPSHPSERLWLPRVFLARRKAVTCLESLNYWFTKHEPRTSIIEDDPPMPTEAQSDPTLGF